MDPQYPFELADAPELTIVESDGAFASGQRAPYLEIIVPAYNEEIRLGETLREIAQYLARQPYEGAITVVDNGSVDRTADLVVDDGASHVPIRLIGCAQRGKGAAVRRGILTSKARFVGFSDADLSTPIATLDTILPALEQGNPVVIASRRCPGAEYVISQPLVRRVASRSFRAASQLCHSQLGEVHDTQCGFKFFEARAARRIFAASGASGFAFDVEILALSFMAGYGVHEVPAVWEHCEGSKLTVIREASAVAKELISMRRNLVKVARSDFALNNALVLSSAVEIDTIDRIPSGVKVELPIADEAITAAA